MTLSWRIVDYNNDVYVVYKIYYKEQPKLFVTHISDLFKVLKYKSWHKSSENYISHGMFVHKDRKELYLHNLVMNKMTFDGKGQASTVDHINRIGTDNRKENLRIVTQSEQNFNQSKKKRVAELPTNCGFTWDDVPKCVWYSVSKNKHHIIVVEIKNVDGDDILWSSTASKRVSLKFKLEHAKKYLRNLREKQPELFKTRNLDGNNVTDEMIELTKSYNKILKKSGFNCYEQNKAPIPERIDLLAEDLTGLTDEEIELLESIEIGTTNNRCKVTRLPEGSGVTLDMLPKYVSYIRPSGNKGECFLISGCPQLGKHQKWSSTSSRMFSTLDKYNQIMEKYHELFDEEI